MLNNALLVDFLENNGFDVNFMKKLGGACNCNNCSCMENVLEAIQENDNILDIDSIEDTEEMHNIDNDNYFTVFYDCMECIHDYSLRHYVKYCDYHHEVEISENEFITIGWNTYCEKSEGYAFNYCEECNEPYEIEDLYYHDNTGSYYCEECYPRVSKSGYVYEYHDWDGEYNPIGTSKNDIYLGFEIEVISDYDLMDCINNFVEICENNNFNWERYFHIEEDGSLNNGVEFISQPLSFEVANLIIPKITKYLKYANFEVDNSCGGHIHITKNDFTKSRMIDVLQFMELNKDFIFDYSQRSMEKFNRWSPFYNTNLGELKNIALDNIWSDRYHTINFRNLNTIEFRLFKGTLSYRNILANIEFIKLLLFNNVNKTHNKYRIREIIDSDIEEYRNLDIYIGHYLNNAF